MTCRPHPYPHFLCMALVALTLLGAMTTAQGQARYTYSAAGDEVTDTQTGLVWRRCSEGQAWSGGTCTGSAATYTHEQALARATAQMGTAGWRLPNVKELASLADKTRTDPAINTTAFPATPSNWYWSSTPYAGDASRAWFVSFYNGNVGYDHVRYHYYHHVRLVR
jgi:Protein of unknown function (DUF1566)